MDSDCVVDIDETIPIDQLKPNTRVALHAHSQKVAKIMPSKVDPIVSLMKVEKVPDSTYDMCGGLDKQIAEIKSTADYKRVCLSLEENYGPVPDEVGNLLVIAVLKAYAARFGVKKISVSKAGGKMELPSMASLSDRKINAAMEEYRKYLTVHLFSKPQAIVN